MQGLTARYGWIELLVATAIMLASAGVAHAVESALVTPSGLRCEGAVNPIGIEQLQPRLSWIDRARIGARRGERQTAYQIVAATSPGALANSRGDLWSAGKIVSGDSVAILYRGKPLPQATRCWWKVRVWDDHGVASPWSEASYWDTGLNSRSDWHAGWIGAPSEVEAAGAPCFRKVFTAEPGWRYARVFVCGLGYHVLYVNGRKADNRLLEPAQTDYLKRAIYSAYDVTSLIRPGANAIGVMLGNGWYNQDRVWGGMSYGKPALILRLELEYPNGRRTAVVTGPDWQVESGPIVSNNIYAGETYDARREHTNWCTTAESDPDWKPVRLLDRSPTERLTSTTMPPIRAVGRITPIGVREISPGVLVYDMGQNFAGWARIQVRAAAGTRIRMRFAETANRATGQIDTASTGVFATGVEQVDKYICRGPDTRTETWEPHFTYHGFRYLEVTGLPPGVRPQSVTGIVLRTDVTPIGEFACSDPMLNRIHCAAVWTLVSNLYGHPTDCPARERCGWLGDSHACAEMAAMNFDMSDFWTKFLGDIQTSWTDTLPCDIAPGKRGTGASGHPDWGVAVVMLPWYRFLYYGDPNALREAYPSMARYVRAVAKQRKEDLVTAGYGDWCPPGSVEPTATPVPLTSTAWFIHAATITSEAALRLGQRVEGAEFREMASRSMRAFQTRFYDPTSRSFGSQTGDAMALAFGLAPSGEVQAVADDLNRDVIRHGYHHDTGIFGSRYLFACLATYGHGDTAWKVLHQTDYPSIGYLFSLGATTFWECWGEADLDKRWGARSLNHPMQAGYDAWFFQGLGGIQPDPDGPGFRRIMIRPEILSGLTWVRARYDSPHGRVSVSWRRTARRLVVDVVIPVNSTATLYLPETDAHLIMEGGRSIRNDSSISFLKRNDHDSVLGLLSGRFEFSMPSLDNGP